LLVGLDLDYHLRHQVKPKKQQSRVKLSRVFDNATIGDAPPKATEPSRLTLIQKEPHLEWFRVNLKDADELVCFGDWQILFSFGNSVVGRNLILAGSIFDSFDVLVVWS